MSTIQIKFSLRVITVHNIKRPEEQSDDDDRKNESPINLTVNREELYQATIR